jgi:hypothetical protein
VKPFMSHSVDKHREHPTDAHPPEAGGNEAEPMPRRFFSLRIRMVGLVALMLVPWLVVVVYTQADEREAAIVSVHGDEMRLIRIVTSNQAAQIEEARQLLTAFARLPQLHTKDASACNAFLAEMLTAYPLYLNFALAEPDGNILCSAVPLRSPSISPIERISGRPLKRATLPSAPIRSAA